MTDRTLAGSPDAIIKEGAGILAIHKGKDKVWSASYVTVNFRGQGDSSRVTCAGGSGKADVKTLHGVPAVVGPGRTGLSFYGLSFVTSVDMSAFDASAMTNCSSLFSGAKSLTAFTPPASKASAVTAAANMFGSCASLKAASLTFLEDSSPVNCTSMFADCQALEQVDLGTLAVGSIRLDNAFKGCTSLRKIRCSQGMKSYLKRQKTAVGLDQTPMDMDSGFIDAAAEPPLQP